MGLKLCCYRDPILILLLLTAGLMIKNCILTFLTVQRLLNVGIRNEAAVALDSFNQRDTQGCELHSFLTEFERYLQVRVLKISFFEFGKNDRV